MKNHWIKKRQDNHKIEICFNLKVNMEPLKEGLRKAREVLSSFTEVEDIIQKIAMPVMVNGIAVASFKPFADLSLKDFMETEDLVSLCKEEVWNTRLNVPTVWTG